MDKKMMIGIGVGIVVIIALIFAFSGGDNDNSSSSSSTSSSSSASSEEEKFAKFQAELTCELMSANSAGDIEATMKKTVSVMDKYGYDDAGYKTLETKYKDNAEFKELIISEMEKQCPTVASQLNA